MPCPKRHTTPFKLFDAQAANQMHCIPQGAEGTRGYGKGRETVVLALYLAGIGPGCSQAYVTAQRVAFHALFPAPPDVSLVCSLAARLVRL